MGVNGVELGVPSRGTILKGHVGSALVPLDHLHRGLSKPGASRDASHTCRQRCCKRIHLMEIEILDATGSHYLLDLLDLLA